MIVITVDLKRLRAPDSASLRADNVDDYVRVRQQIRRALDERRALSVYLTSPVLVHAFADLRGYGDAIVWRDIEPLAMFERFFGQPSSQLFDADRIAALDIATLPVPPPQTDPLSWVLAHRLDSMFGFEHPPAGHERTIIAWAAAAPDLSPVLHDLLDALLARWAETAPLYKRLRNMSLRADARSLLLRAALKR